ncbi:hypothetical protein L0P70_06365 [Faecalibacterium prausnitzii]|uniref:hypothetical protein n=1 Tax=Faecalibacterium prausnitzii TaxID=853 RepID=UPI001C27663D|nr:hypothetical protein [Faecalibacterium prausnitzii]MBV0928288.1 hypothetical protein [Faecalibacterium prausnitzii]MCG4794467.1 hypothetical protein [Faecalibacterium prausnitzii]MCG4800335.1 hypothetical protein [Faecalibacterium prausnitzii]MDE8725335.1 hypothetical protein [Faecalibacterium prausnitzii]
MKNWKKLLACLLVSLMALTVFTACDASVGAPMGPEHSNAESASVKALCDRFKVSYSEELSDKAYTIASWVAGTEPSCQTSKDKLYRWAHVDNVVKTYLEKKSYATAFENMGMGILGTDTFTPGFDWKPDADDPSDIIFVLPKDGTYPEAMTKAAEGKTKLGVAYVVKDRVSYAVVLFG